MNASNIAKAGKIEASADIKAEIGECLDVWTDALNDNDIERVVSLYSPVDSSLIPTRQNGPYRTIEKIRGYFTDFIADKPQGEIVEVEIRALGSHNAVANGLYTFRFGNGNVTRARFTFIWEREEQGGDFLIVHHHSSAMPERS